MSDICLDLRFALRTFARRPGLTAIAALTLALGIGASTAVFSIVDAVLLRRLPYKSPERLVAVWVTSTREKSLAKLFATYRDFAEFRPDSRSFDDLAVMTWAKRLPSVMTGSGPARELLMLPASPTFFEMLGVNAAIGRTFNASDDGRGCSVVLAHKFWNSVMGSDPSIAGKSLTIDRKACTVTGVMPESFSFYPTQTQAWILLGRDFQADQDSMQVGIFGRLKPGATASQAQAELRNLSRAIHTEGETRDWEPVVYDLHGEFTFLAGRNLRNTLVLVFAAVLFVLMIACLNVANLLLARFAERRRELAVRSALGSGRHRLIRQMLTEGLMLAMLGALPGIALAWAGVRYFRVASPIELSVGGDARMNLPVLGFSVLLSLATTLLFGLLPAMRASRVDLIENLKAGGKGMIGGRHALAKGLIAAEVALSFLLLIGAGLLMTSALRMGAESLGFRPEHVLSTGVTLPAYRYPNEAQRLRFFDDLLSRLNRLPGVADVTLASKVPPQAGGNQVLEVGGRAVDVRNGVHDVGADAVSPRFFDVLGIPLLRGRVFGRQDRENSPAVVIVNDALAREYFPNQDPIGRQIRLTGGPMPWLTIVGIVGNLKHTQLMNEMSWIATPIMYRPLAQESRTSVQIVVRVNENEAELRQQIRQQIAAIDPAIPSSEVEPISARLAKILAYPRFRAMILALFAAGALVLSAVGLHGVLSQFVVQRMPEFGVRRAVGAQTRDLIWLVAAQGGTAVAGGLVAGLCLALAFSRVVASMLYGIDATNPGALAAVSGALLLAAMLATVLPAWRASRVDPMVALREE